MRHGVPEILHVDNGATYASDYLTRVCAELRIALRHSTVRRPEGTGKIERVLRRVDQPFTHEARALIAQGQGRTLADLHALGRAGVADGYHAVPHHGLDGQTPAAAWAASQAAHPPRRVDWATLPQGFLWTEKRRVDKTGVIPWAGNRYEVARVLAGRTVVCRYDPFDLPAGPIAYPGQDDPDAVPRVLRHHRHREVPAPEPEDAAVPASGLHYVALLAARAAARPTGVRYGPGEDAYMLPAFGFTRMPFTTEIPATELFPRRALRELAARLQVMVDTRAFGVVTGEIRAGKSSAVRPLAAQLDPVRHPVGYLAESALHPTDFDAQVLDAFGGAPRWRRSFARRPFHDLMRDRYTHPGTVPVLICDEAPQLPSATLPEFRYIAHRDMDALSPFACILVGQPDLRTTLRQRIVEAVQQRLTLRYHLTDLDRDELGAYLAHHCRVAGVDRPMFSPAAAELLFQHSHGVPRVVTRLAAAALWDAAGHQAAIVDADHIEHAVGEWREPSPGPRLQRRAACASGVAVIRVSRPSWLTAGASERQWCHLP